jgi:hypothetical protein
VKGENCAGSGSGWATRLFARQIDRSVSWHIGGGVSQSDGQRECSFFSHIPFPQIGSDGFPASAIFAIAQTKHAVNNNKTKKFLFGFPASAIFAIAQTKHAVNNNKTKKFLFDIIIFSFRYVDLSSFALLIRTVQFAHKRKT